MRRLRVGRFAYDGLKQGGFAYIIYHFDGYYFVHSSHCSLGCLTTILESNMLRARMREDQKLK